MSLFSGYDGANRLLTFTETGSTANQTFSYDQFGNRWVASGWIPYAGQTPTSNVFPYNRWAAGSGVTYDNAGNQTGITTPVCLRRREPADDGHGELGGNDVYLRWRWPPRDQDCW